MCAKDGPAEPESLRAEALHYVKENAPVLALVLVPVVALKALAVGRFRLSTALSIVAESSAVNLAALLFTAALYSVIVAALNILSLVAQVLAIRERYWSLAADFLLATPLVLILYLLAPPPYARWLTLAIYLPLPLGVLGMLAVTRRDRKERAHLRRMAAEARRQLQLWRSTCTKYREAHLALQKKRYLHELPALASRLDRGAERITERYSSAALSYARRWIPLMVLLLTAVFSISSTPWLAPQRIDVVGLQPFTAYVLAASPAEVVILQQDRLIKRIPNTALRSRQYCLSEADAARGFLPRPSEPVCPSS